MRMRKQQLHDNGEYDLHSMASSSVNKLVKHTGTRKVRFLFDVVVSLLNCLCKLLEEGPEMWCTAKAWCA